MTAAMPVRPEVVADAVRADVLAGTITPGTAVTESAVGARFDIARSTARSAIDRLVGEGLLTRSAHAAARVPVLDRAAIVEIYDARSVVERAAVAAVAAAGAVPPAAVAANRALASAAPADGFAPHDIAFHRALVGGQPNSRLVRMHDALMGEIELCIGQVPAHRLLDPATIAAEHRGVLDAVVAGDVALAERLVGEHIRHSRDRILTRYDTTH